MNVIALDYIDLVMAAVLVAALGMTSLVLRLGIGRKLSIAAMRTAVQLLLVGLILKLLFENVHLGWVTLMALVMLLVAGREAGARQERRMRRGWSFGIGTASMFVSSRGPSSRFTVNVFLTGFSLPFISVTSTSIGTSSGSNIPVLTACAAFR